MRVVFVIVIAFFVACEAMFGMPFTITTTAMLCLAWLFVGAAVSGIVYVLVEDDFGHNPNNHKRMAASAIPFLIFLIILILNRATYIGSCNLPGC